MTKQKKEVDVVKEPSKAFLRHLEIEQFRSKIADVKKGFDFNSLDDAQLGVVIHELLAGVQRTYLPKYLRRAVGLLKGGTYRIAGVPARRYRNRKSRVARSVVIPYKES